MSYITPTYMSQSNFFFFFQHKSAYELRISDWSSDVCSSDLLVEGDRHQHPRARAGGPLGGAVGGDETLLQQVVLGRRIQLDRAAGAVVVGDHQALGRNEARGAAAQRYHGVHRDRKSTRLNSSH